MENNNIIYLKFNSGRVTTDEALGILKKVQDDYKDCHVYGFPVDNDSDTGIFFASNNDNIEVKVKKDSEEIVLPSYAHSGDIGLDIKATSVEYNSEYDYYAYHTGLHIEMPEGVYCLIFPRSSNRKKDCYLCNSIGLIDNSYRGELIVSFKNRTSYDVNCMLSQWKYMNKITMGVDFSKDSSTLKEMSSKMVEKASNEPFKMPEPMDFSPYEIGDKVAQLVFIRLDEANLNNVKELSNTERGEGGFGSTGK